MESQLWIILLVMTAAIAALPAMRYIVSAAGRLFDRLAQRPVAAVLAVGIFSFLTSASLSLLGVVPAPGVHDEFSYLLAADTFASGRLANPTHPLWQHLETMHVLHEPVYASKFPPAQGLALALGIVLMGDPIAGVWLSTAAACAAVCWMLLAWVPGRWAIAGGLLAALHPTVLGWSHSFWGGAVAMGAAALLLGGYRRLLDEPRTGAAIAMSLGIALLVNSRPYEGLLLTPLLAMLAWSLYTRRLATMVIAQHILMPLAAILIITATAMAFYNWRITGRPAMPPYALHDQTYCRTPHFVWQSLRPAPPYRHRVLAEFHDGWEPEHWRQQQSLAGWAAAAADKVRHLASYAFAPGTLAIALLGLPMLLRHDRRAVIIGAVGLFFVLGQFPITWSLSGCSHRVAPAAPLILLMLTGGLWQLNQRRWGKPLARITLAIVPLAAGQTAMSLFIQQVDGWQRERARMVEQLQSDGGDHIVLVRHLPGHDILQEWVHNAADIENSRIVWARELDPEADQRLLHHFRSRTPWLLELGPGGTRLSAYPRR